MSNQNENQAMDLLGLLDEAQEAAIDTSRPYPEDGEYEAVIEKLEPPRVEIIKKQGPNFGKSIVLMDVHYRLKDWKIEGRDETPTIKSAIFIDLNESGRLDMAKGKNIQLGLLKEATGCNKPGSSPRDVMGVPLKVRVKNEANGENTNTRVVKWAPLPN